jgi:predicted P-loop ATPase
LAVVSVTDERSSTVNDTETWIHHIAGDPDAILCWQPIDDGPDPKRKFRPFYGRLSERIDELKAQNADNIGVFATVADTDGGGRKEANITAVRACYVDVDDKHNVDFEAIGALLQPSMVVHGRGPGHIYYRLVAGQLLSLFRQTQKGLITGIGTDPVIHDLTRVMRVPGFNNHKHGGCVPVTIKYVHDLKYTYEQIWEVFPPVIEPLRTVRNPGKPRAGASSVYSPPEPKPGQVLKPLEMRREYFARYLAASKPAIEGEGGDPHTWKMARVGTSDFLLTPEQALPAFEAWNETCVPPWDGDELEDKLFRSAEDPLSGSKAFMDEPLTHDLISKTFKGFVPAPVEEEYTPEQRAKDEAKEDQEHIELSNQGTVNTALRNPEKLARLLNVPVGQLSVNIRNEQIFVGDRQVKIEHAVTRCLERSGLVFAYETKGRVQVPAYGRETFTYGLELVASDNEYDPVARYLDNLPPWDGADRFGLLLEALHLQDSKPLYEIFIRRTLIGAVRRVRQPGCKLDTMLILHEDKGGVGKSSFFKALFGTEFFSDSQIDLNQKDKYLPIRRFWGIEWQEMDALRRAGDREQVKAFLTSAEDTFRKSYARNEETHPRRSVFVGTTNQREILENDGGNRRFWIIPNCGIIDVKWVRENRDQLWAQASVLEAADEDHWIGAGTDEERDLEEEQGSNMHEDMALEKCQAWALALTKDFVTSHEAIVGVFYSWPGASVLAGRREQVRIAALLKVVGFRSGTKRVDGKMVKGWKRDAAIVAVT